MPRRALVLIDIQNDYFPGGKWTLSGIDAAADNAAWVLAAARVAGDLVVHARHEFPTADVPFFAPGSDGAKIHPKVMNLKGEPVVLKHHVNAFRETDLKAILDRHGVEEVVTAAR
jgi:nicotinamidase-related amidase